EFLCRRDLDALDVGANDGSYVHFLRRHARHVFAFETMPVLAAGLGRKFRRGGTIEPIALSDAPGTVSLHMPVVDGVTVMGCSTVAPQAYSAYPPPPATEAP